MEILFDTYNYSDRACISFTSCSVELKHLNRPFTFIVNASFEMTIGKHRSIKIDEVNLRKSEIQPDSQTEEKVGIDIVKYFSLILNEKERMIVVKEISKIERDSLQGTVVIKFFDDTKHVSTIKIPTESFDVFQAICNKNDVLIY